MCRWRWVRRRRRKGATAAPVFENETRPVRAHPVLPQELLEPLLQLRLPNLPLVHGRVSSKTVAVVNAGVIEAGHRGCCSAAGARALGQPQPPPPKYPAGSPLAECPAPHPTARTGRALSPQCPRDIPVPDPVPIPIPCPSAPRSPPELGTNFSRQKRRAAETKPVQGACAASALVGSDWSGRPPAPPRKGARGAAVAADWPERSAPCPPLAVWREIGERRAGGGEMAGGLDHCDGVRRGSG